MCITAVTLLDEIIHQYQLTPFNETTRSLDTMKLIVATSTSIRGFLNANWNRPSFVIQPPSSQTISALTKINTAVGNLLAFTTSAGQLHLFDDQGMCIDIRQISQYPLWSITSALVGQRPLLFITAAENVIHVCDARGELLGTIETPTPVFSLTIKQIEGQTILFGGLQNRNQVCVWNLQAIIQRQDATPTAILQGGRLPAFATIFIENGDCLWLAHSCWDNQLYFYHWPLSDGRKSIPSFLQLKATQPIYSIQSIAYHANLYLLASTANGDILAWDITNEEISDPKLVARLGTRVRQIKALKISEQWYLLVGDKNGRLTTFHLANMNSPELSMTLTTNGSEIQGIDIL